MTNLGPVILTLNAGSSSLKFAAFALVNGGELELIASGQIEGIGAAAQGDVKTATGEKSRLTFYPSGAHVDHEVAMSAILGWLRQAGYDSSVAAVGHRVVHGGLHLVEPKLIDESVIATLKGLIPLAPLHEPHNLAGILAAIKAFPSTPQVACFDTAFHRSHPFVDDTFALPRSYYDEGVRRYGFHGLSYEFITRKLRKIAPQVAREDVVIAHLGNGASMCA
ncbi:MAG: acetate kinase, partial [Roseiarcus sp.]